MTLEYKDWRVDWRGAMLSFFWTTLFCVAVSVPLWHTELAGPFLPTLATSLTIGWSICAAHVFLGCKLEPLLGLTITNIVATALGLTIALGLVGLYGKLFESATTIIDWPTAGPALFFGIIGTLIITNIARVHHMREELTNAEVHRLATERALTQAQLKTLQAQIEPHFLFNTLTTAIGLIHTNPDAAEKTLEQLTRLLRHSLSRTRTEHTTLGEEFELIRAYLGIAKIRMGDRLSYRITCSDDLGDFTLPPMLVQPLVENALTHGVEPAEDGGKICLDAVRTGQGIEITITDNGLGLNNHAATQGTSTGLRNVRDRLQQLYGSSSSLRLSENSPSGVSATLLIPESR